MITFFGRFQYLDNSNGLYVGREQAGTAVTRMTHISEILISNRGWEPPSMTEGSPCFSQVIIGGFRYSTSKQKMIFSS
jgi:hypothetical protein